MPSTSTLPLFASVLTVDLGFTSEEESFRQEVRTWLEANLPQAWRQDGKGGYRDEEDTGLQREWQRKLYDGGWLKLGWPREVGGRGATPVMQAIYQEEMAKAGAPRRDGGSSSRHRLFPGRHASTRGRGQAYQADDRRRRVRRDLPLRRRGRRARPRRPARRWLEDRDDGLRLRARRPCAGCTLREGGRRARGVGARPRRGRRRDDAAEDRPGLHRGARLPVDRASQPDSCPARPRARARGQRDQALLERDGQAAAGGGGRRRGDVRRARGRLEARRGGWALAV